ncbi:unnamed protein product [Rhizoctonia solani]|uniref:Uncharacterized protein n=1 Tax=Rhizoctonia solani TaxID=456999 RepID=A0A8H2XWR1_9AGAM|nr:unnamed protein product [Rhizoctonia solani]
MLVHNHQTQLPVGRLIQGATVSPRKTPLQAKEEHPPTDDLLNSVLSWLNQGAPDWLHLRNIKSEEFERVLSKLHSLGIKPRFDWDAEMATATMRSPTKLHEYTSGWFCHQAMDVINEKLAQVGICGRPSLTHNGAAGVGVGPSAGASWEFESSVSPDQSLYLRQIDTNGRVVKVQEAPRIVLETSASQSREHIMEKVFKYLYDTDGAVHAAVICDLTNMHPLTVPRCGHKAKPFKAEIATWVPGKTGNDELDYPLDKCYHHEALGDHKVGRALTDDSGSGSDSSSESDDGPCTTSPVSGPNFDRNAREYYRINPKNPKEKQYIYRRSPEWIVLCDDLDPAIQESPIELTLDVYDILRPCSNFPNNYIEDRQISIPLGILRQELMIRVQDIRDPPETEVPALTSTRKHPSPKSHARQEPPKKKRRVRKH